MKKESISIIFIIIYSFIVLYPFLRYSTVFRGNDLIANVSGFVYLKEVLLNQAKFPQWNFYLGTGLPTMSDPLNSFFNPLIFSLFTIFDIVSATRYLIFIVFCFSGITLYFLIRSFKIIRIIALLSGLTYMSSGYLAARLVSGHLEKIIAYALIPIFYHALFLWKEDKKNYFAPILLGVVFSLLVLSASIYELFYGLLIFAAFTIYIFIEDLVQKKGNTLPHLYFLVISSLIFIILSAWKFIPMIIYSSTMQRQVSPLLGSQNLQSIIHNFFIFTDPSNQSLPNIVAIYPYRWWESISYIGPLPLLTLIYWIFSKKAFKYKLLMFILGSVAVMFSAIDNKLNPFYWLVQVMPLLHNFRIPSRIFIYLVPLMLLIYAQVFNKLNMKSSQLLKLVGILLIFMNLVVVLWAFRFIYYKHNFLFVNPDFEQTLNFQIGRAHV